jgi:hypothetical protein
MAFHHFLGIYAIVDTQFWNLMGQFEIGTGLISKPRYMSAHRFQEVLH